MARHETEQIYPVCGRHGPQLMRDPATLFPKKNAWQNGAGGHAARKTDGRVKPGSYFHETQLTGTAPAGLADR